MDTRIFSTLNNRLSRSKESPKLRRQRVIEGSAEKQLQPLKDKMVSTNDFRYAVDVLEASYAISESYGNKIRRYISENVIPGIEDPGYISDMIRDQYPQYSSVFDESLSQTMVANRIISNQEKMNKRFNLDNCMKSALTEEHVKDAIFEMCKLIDTYSMPPHVKMNIALENILYTCRNNKVGSASLVAENVTEYFLNRDLSISDTEYKKYQHILKTNPLFDLADYGDIGKEIMSNSGTFYKDVLRNLLFKITNMPVNSIAQNLDSIKTEEDFINFLDKLEKFNNDNYLTNEDRARLYKIIDLIPKAINIDESMVRFERDKRFDADDIAACADILSDDDIAPITQPIAEKQWGEWGSDIFDKSALINAFSESTDFADSKDITDAIVKFKAEQDKSPNKFKALLHKFHARKPEDIIDGIPNVMGAVRAIFIFGVSAAIPLGPVFGALLALIDHAINRSINDKQAEKLLLHLRNEKKLVKSKLEKSSNENKKKELEDYIKCLDKCIAQVEEYADKLSGDDHSDPDGDDDEFSFDDDFSFESAIIAMGTVLEAADQTIEFLQNELPHDLFVSTLNKLADNGLLRDFILVANHSAMDIDSFANILGEARVQLPNDARIVTEFTSAVQKFNNDEPITGIYGIVAEAVANNAIREIVQEGFNLNTIKLALQNAKAKLKNLSMKEKSMWMTVDAHASGMVKSIEKAMTSDRREAIIKGSIIPSFSKCIKSSIALAGIGVFFGPGPALISAIGGLAMSKALNAKEKKLIYDEIDTELHVVEKQIELAQNDGDMNQYRFLLNYQKKLTRENQRIKYGLRAQGRDLPKAANPY